MTNKIAGDKYDSELLKENDRVVFSVISVY